MTTIAASDAGLQTSTTAPTGTDPDDARPVWAIQPGRPLRVGLLALDRLGVGLRCETWLSWSVPLWCPVVVKLARPDQVDHPRARRSLRREVEVLAHAVHPGLPRLFLDASEDDVPHLVLEFLDGIALDDLIDDAPLAPADAALLAAQLLSAVAAVHAAGLAHVDIKPENVLVSGGRPMLIDFGSARRLGSDQPPGRPIGTAGYAAPELEAGDPIGPGIDLYGVGTVVHEALTGVPAFDDGLAAGVRPPPADLPDDVPGDLSELVRALLEPRPADRPGLGEALTVLAAVAAVQERRPWPKWADAELSRRFGDRRAERDRVVPPGSAVSPP